MKQALLVRMDLRMGKGKIASQCAHASVESVFHVSKTLIDAWRKEGMKKVVLKVADEKALLKYKADADARGLATVLITDAGHTQIEPGSTTCLAIGPAADEKIDALVGKLKLL